MDAISPARHPQKSSQRVRACVEGDGAICSKNRKIVSYHGASPNTRNGARFLSPSPIMAPDADTTQSNLRRLRCPFLNSGPTLFHLSSKHIKRVTTMLIRIILCIRKLKCFFLPLKCEQTKYKFDYFTLDNLKHVCQHENQEQSVVTISRKCKSHELRNGSPISEFSLKPARAFNSVALKNQEAIDHVFLKEHNSLDKCSVKKGFTWTIVVYKILKCKFSSNILIPPSTRIFKE